MARSARCGWTVVAALVVLSACTGNRSGGVASGNAGTATTGATPPVTRAARTFGDLVSPCGDGAARRATDQGVTAQHITIGYGDDAGAAPAPGLDHELGDAMKAMIKWCNARGGINGRQIDGVYYDAKLTEVGNVMLAACRRVFMLVGEGYALDASGEAIRVGCGLPAVPGYAVSGDFTNAPLMYQAVPGPVDYFSISVAGPIAKRFPEQVKRTAVLYGNFSATIDTKDKMVATYPSLGFRFVPCSQTYNLAGEADWKPIALRLKNCGAEVVYFLGTAYPNFENYLEAADQLGYHPIYVVEGLYDEGFARWNTAGLGNNVYGRVAFVPFEDASKNEATKQYVDLVTADGGDVSLLGGQAASSFLLWATAVKDCGNDVTRVCVLDKLSQVHRWTGGGLHAPTDPGANMPPSCGVVVKLDGPRWVRWYPKQVASFDCSPSYVAKVTGPVVDNAKLGPDRVSTKYRP